MTAGACLRALIASVAVVLPSVALAADAKLRGPAIDQRLDGEPLLLEMPKGVSAIVRLKIEQPASTGPTDDVWFRRLHDVLDAYATRKTRVILAIGAVPASDDDVENWRQSIRRVAEEARGKVVAFQIGEIAAPPASLDRYTYLVKLAAVQIRSIDPDALLLGGSVPATEIEWEKRVLAGDAGAYLDGVAIDAGADSDEASAAVQEMAATIVHEKPSAIVLVGPIHLPDDPSVAAARFVDAALRALGTDVHVIAFEGRAASANAALQAAGRFSDLIGGDLVALDERNAGLKITSNGSDVTSSLGHRLLYSPSSFETYFVYWGSSLGPTIDVDITVANASTPMVRDPATGRSQPALGTKNDPATNRLRVTLPLSPRPLIVDFNFGNAAGFGASVNVEKEALLRVDEIIFHYQQVQAAQDAFLQNYIAHVRIEQHFHPSPADPAYNLITENRLFSDRTGVEWEELSFELNGAKWTANRPSFPLVQPEKVLSLPLDLRLNRDYRYRLEGTDIVNGRPAYVVRFDPLDSVHALYRGTVWIDRRTFQRLKVQAVETRLNGPIVSNDETQIFEPSGDVDGRQMWLLNRLSSKQIFLVAGRSVLIEREVHLSDFTLNRSDFERQREIARAGNRIMYRDTDQGVRYLVKQGESRVVSNQLTTSARAIALGTDVDPSFDYPLPIGGINILDFNFLNRNMQLALLYGGVIALGNIQHPNLWGGRFDASLDFFGLAVKSNDDVFDANGRLRGERVDRIPASVGFNLGYQVSPFQKITGHYELKYDAYFRDSTTSASFVVPSNTITNGAGGGYEYRRRGYSLLANAAYYRRATWDEWGDGNDFDPDDRTYTKYDVGLSKDFTFKTFQTIHLNGTYFSGQRLDRFSMYQFGLFDPTRMHGVPSAVRFADLGMFRGSYSFNVLDQYRLDLFLDHARGRDAQTDVWLPVTGTGIRLNLRAPKSTILQVDFGKSFLPEVYRGAGSYVLQILLLKPL